MESAYNSTKLITPNPFFGFYEDIETGKKFVDISFPISGVSEKEVIATAENLAQDSIVRISGTGKFDLVYTIQPKLPKTGKQPVL